MGCMPEPVNKVVGSFSGTKEAEGKITCALDLKKSMYFWRISLTVINARAPNKDRLDNRVRQWDPANCGRLPNFPSSRSLNKRAAVSPTLAQ
jgi:hypothetical protein